MSPNIVRSRARLEQLFLDGALAPLQAFLTKAAVEGWARDVGHRWRSCVFSPLATLLACVYKQFSAPVSCRGVADWIAGAIAQSAASHGDDFCLARKRLPESVFAQAVRHTAKLAQDSSSPPVLLVDGTGVNLPRSDANLSAFGRAGPKARLPLARLLLFSHAHSGAVTEADVTGCHEGELRQFLRCLPRLAPGTILVADRQFCSYLALHEMSQRGVFGVMRLNVSRKPVSIQPLGSNDEIQVWRRTRLNAGAFQDQLRLAPEEMAVRVVRGRIERKGYRPVEIAVATNLLDATRWPPEKVIELYGLRWGVENDIRDLKLRHGLSMLSCKSSDTVRKEIWSALLAYNCVKLLLSRAGQFPRRLSHKRAGAVILEASMRMAEALTTCLPAMYRELIRRLSRLVLVQQERPPCPRALVRNTQSSYPFLYQSRQAWHARYLAA